MAMDFFQQQDKAKQRTSLLVVYFTLAIITLTVLLYLLTAVLFLDTSPKPGVPPTSLWNPMLFLGVAAVVCAVVGGTSAMKMIELSSGGESVALLLGGEVIQGDAVDARHRRLLNIVEEMAIASGVPVPPVYVLKQETGINAFAAGHGPGDAVVAVSQGSLNYLTRDELQGVVAHEFSHILNGDMRLDLRLLGLIHGILAIYLLGRIVMESVRWFGSSSSDDSGEKKMSLSTAIFLFGLGLFLLGLAGAFFGWLIQAAVSRQREFLADASAVQFTRNPDGIGGALKKIGGLEGGSTVANVQAEEVRHMFFADAFNGRSMVDWFATHPPLEERIRRIDPNFDGRYPEVKITEAEAAPEPVKAAKRGPEIPMAVIPVLAAAGDVTKRVGRSTSRDTSVSVTSRIPDALRDATRDPFAAQALIYCLMLDERPEVNQQQLAQLQAGIDPRQFELVRRLADLARTLPEATRLPLVDLSMPALRQMSPEQHRQFRALVDAMIQADGRVSVFDYALGCVLYRYLDATFYPRRLSTSTVPEGSLRGQVVCVLSRLAWEGQDEPEAAQKAFAAGMASYTKGGGPTYRMLPREQCSLTAFDTALRALDRGTPDVKRRLLEACNACLVTDGKVTAREDELVRAVGAVLGCPVPPVAVSEA